MNALEQRMGVVLAMAAGFLVAACTSTATPTPSAGPPTQATSMDSKDGGMGKGDAMDLAKTALESEAAMEKAETTMADKAETSMMEKAETTMMDQADAMPGTEQMETKDGATMGKPEAMDATKGSMETGTAMGQAEGAANAAVMEKTEGMMGETETSGAMQSQPAAARQVPAQRVSPHFVVSSPKHGERLAQVPARIQINFDFTLHETSAIAVTKDGTPVAAGAIPVNPRGLVLAATLPDAGEGLYVVGYRACWPDRSCHDGQFAFTVGN